MKETERTRASNDVMTRKQLAEYLNVSYDWSRRYATKFFTFVQLNGHTRFTKIAVDETLARIQIDERHKHF